MKLVLYGSPLSITKAEAREAVLFYAGRLLSRQLRPHIKAKIFFKEGYMKDEGLEGTCCWDDDNLRAREFIIKVDRALTKRKMLLTLAHEAVHMKQYAKGELKYYLRGAPCRWKGVAIDERSTLYDDLPWEKEAWELEHILYKEFKDHVKKCKSAHQKSRRARSKVAPLSKEGC